MSQAHEWAMEKAIELHKARGSQQKIWLLPLRPFAAIARGILRAKRSP